TGWPIVTVNPDDAHLILMDDASARRRNACQPVVGYDWRRTSTDPPSTLTPERTQTTTPRGKGSSSCRLATTISPVGDLIREETKRARSPARSPATRAPHNRRSLES